MMLVLIRECKPFLSRYFRDSQYIARRRVGFIKPVLIAAALFLPALFLYSQQTIAGDCGAFQQGTEQSNGVFVPGTAPSDIDYRGECSGDQSDGVNEDSISNFYIIDVSNPDTRVIIDVTDVTDDHTSIDLAVGDHNTNATLVLRGEIDEPAVTDYVTVVAYGSPPVGGPQFVNDVKIESYLNISNAGDGRRALALDNSFGGNASVRNYGEIRTSGNGYLRPVDGMYRQRRADGISVFAGGSNLQGQTVGNTTAINEVGGRIITEGDGARAINSNSEGGTATAINRGFVETMGDTYDGFPNDGLAYRASGVYANSTNGDAIAENSGDRNYQREMGRWS